MEDALTRLDKLTQEEARMATAEVLRATHAINDNVKGVREQVLAAGDRLASVDNKVMDVINGAQFMISQVWLMFNLNRSDGKDAKQVMKQAANDLDQAKRSSLTNILSPRLTAYCRRPAAMGRSELALSSRPIDESQLRSEGATQGNCGMVLRDRRINRMESERVGVVDSW
jgi:hypothetical protein